MPDPTWQSSLRRIPGDILAKLFYVARLIKPARERVTLGEFDDHVERDHVARYRFAKQFCAGKRVADIACGTGYGTKILAEVASSVDGYDKVALCGNRVLDLEKEPWDGHFDVIVSFETIEHLANPEFFLENARRTTDLLVVSSPIGELRGYNPHHKQVWDFAQFSGMVDRYFQCTYYVQTGEVIEPASNSGGAFVIAVGKPMPNGHSAN